MVKKEGEEEGKGKEGKNLLGRPKFKKLENERFKCVETGHEVPSHARDSYAQSKRCRIGPIDAALARNKPPLNTFHQDPLVRPTGNIVNKSEEHINGKRFLNTLEGNEQKKKGMKADSDISRPTPSVRNHLDALASLKGEQVAARVTQENAEYDGWFVVKVIHFDRETREFEVLDEEGGDQRKYKLPLSHIIPFPKRNDPSGAQDFPTGKQVLAVYPSTTALYKATVVQPRKRKADDYVLEFDDDEEEDGSLPQRIVPFHWVVGLPEGHRHPTGNIVNKSEEHINGKRFLNTLEGNEQKKKGMKADSDISRPTPSVRNHLDALASLKGEQVAARVTQENAEYDGWFVVKVIHFDRETREFEVLDEEGGDQRKYKLPLSHIIPFPKRNDPSGAQDFPTGKQVLAVYPSTTALYKATVVQPRKRKADDYVLEFDDDEEEDGSLPQRIVPFHWVVGLPEGHRHPTGNIVNKSEEHINGKRFLNTLEGNEQKKKGMKADSDISRPTPSVRNHLDALASLKGEQVAARVTQENAEYDGWFVVKVIHFDRETREFEVLDEEGGDQRKYKLPLSHIIPFPKRNDPSGAQDFPTGKQVLAVYPSTTALYKATVVQPRKRKADDYVLEFDDDEEEDGSLPQRIVPFHWVVGLPEGHRHPTGNIVNKSEEHINGKRFLNTLEGNEQKKKGMKADSDISRPTPSVRNHLDALASLKGEQVAARVTQENAEYDGWFVVKVIHFDRETREFEVLDEEGGDQRKYKLPLSHIIPFPKRNDPSGAQDFPTGKQVLAVYPSTTALYKATVVQPRKRKADDYVLEFDDDEEEDGSLPQRIVPFHRVVGLPEGHRQ